MMRSRTAAKLAALSVAIAAHGALALALVARDENRVEGATGAAEVRLGTAFTDMSAGTLTAAPAEHVEIAEPAPPQRVKAQEATHARSAQAVRPETTPRAAPVPPEKAAPAEPDSPQRAEPAHTPAAKAAPPATPETSATPLAAARPDATESANPPAAQTLRPARTEALAAAPPPDRLEGAEPESAAVARFLRPKPRSEKLAALQPPARDRDPAPKPARRTPSAPGNAEQSARAGDALGKADATARQSGNQGRRQEAGNAAVDNYPGAVMRVLSRAGKPRVNARGAAVIAFTVAAHGGVASVSLAQSSGSPALDQAAVRLVRGAGPFPRPPQGARRSFSVRIQGR